MAALTGTALLDRLPMSARRPFSGKPDIGAEKTPRPLLTDAVEKVGNGVPARNNRIASDDFVLYVFGL